MKKLILILLMLGLAPTVLFGQARTHITTSNALPAPCTVGDLFYNTGTSVTPGLYSCTATNVWTLILLRGSTALFGDGTGAAPSIAFASENTLGLYRKSGGVIGSTGHFVPSSDNSFDLGGSNQNWRNAAVTNLIWTKELALGYNGTNMARIDDVRLRGEFNTSLGSLGSGMLGVVNGLDTKFGDVRLWRLSGGDGGGDPSFTSNVRTVWNLLTTVTDAPIANGFTAVRFVVDYEPSATEPKQTAALYAEFDAGVTGRNFTALNDATVGIYSGMYTNSTSNSTFIDVVGVVGDTEHGSTGTAVHVFGFKNWCCSFDTARPSNAGVIAHAGGYWVTQPFSGVNLPARNTGIWIEDQTAGNSFLPATNEALHVDTPTGTDDFNIAANGDVTAANLRLSTGRARPACTVTNRGQFYATQGAAGVADTVAVCAKSNTDTYAWRTIF